MSASRLRPCRKCGKGILDVIMIDDAGKQKFIVLDPVPAVYELTDRTSMDGTPLVHRVPSGTVMVSHFSTCPHADYFNKGKKAAKGTATGGT